MNIFFLINDVKLPEGLRTQDGIPVKGGHGLNVDDWNFWLLFLN